MIVIESTLILELIFFSILYKLIIVIRVLVIKKHVTGLFGAGVIMTKLYEKIATFILNYL